jgi:hypothetical protein
MSADRFLLVTDPRGVATLTLNRPEVANAYDKDLLRALVIRGAGKHFQAGADITWLNRLSRQGPEENHTASIVTVRFSKTLNEVPKPTLAVIHYACFGGGVGIACCVDVAVCRGEHADRRCGVGPRGRGDAAPTGAIRNDHPLREHRHRLPSAPRGGSLRRRHDGCRCRLPHGPGSGGTFVLGACDKLAPSRGFQHDRIVAVRRIGRIGPTKVAGRECRNHPRQSDRLHFSFRHQFQAPSRPKW